LRGKEEEERVRDRARMSRPNMGNKLGTEHFEAKMPSN
jgi:hypothetical protein